MQSDSPRPANKPQPGGCWIVAAFVGGAVGAWLVTGAIFMKAIEGAELHPDASFLGAVCVFCPLVGLLAALVVWRVAKRNNSR
jgi:hypothetical protein